MTQPEMSPRMNPGAQEADSLLVRIELGDDGNASPHGAGSEQKQGPGEKTENSEEENAETTKNRARAYFLEIGIVVHSVIIGLDLGFTPIDSFTSMLIAICFHQFFEGFALGEAVAEANFSKRGWITSCLLFSFTTPLGMSIALIMIACDAGMDELSTMILTCFCSGILLYVGTCSLLTEWITQSQALLAARPLLPVTAFVSFGIGITIMSVMAIWA